MTPIVDVTDVVDEVTSVLSTEIELSTSIATTSDGDDPHDARTKNIEVARLGPSN